MTFIKKLQEEAKNRLQIDVMAHFNKTGELNYKPSQAMPIIDQIVSNTAKAVAEEIYKRTYDALDLSSTSHRLVNIYNGIIKECSK